MVGLYIHIPFCATKCAYCDFYSLNYNKDTVEKFVEEMCRRLKETKYTFDTVYFGGGTPSIIGADNLSKILSYVKYKQNAEITVEVNPKSYNSSFFDVLYNNGFNRISVGMQSANDEELISLTRNHRFCDVEETVYKAKSAGFKNVSLDVMIGIEKQTLRSLKETLDKAILLDVNHLSCYMLKIEDGTPYSKMSLVLPDEEKVSDMYLFMCDYLEKAGFEQYEISNFSKHHTMSKHNLIYWQCHEYLGLGPAAHSLIKSKRYYFPNDLNYFLEGNQMIFDQEGGDLYDYVMLGLRLKEGIDLNRINNKRFVCKTEKFCNLGYAEIKNNRFYLNPKGFLIQNTILSELLEEL